MSYKFALNELAPIARQCDSEEKYDRDSVRKAAEIGLVAAWPPKNTAEPALGVLGLPSSPSSSRVDMGTGLNIVVASFGTEAIYASGTEEQKKDLHPAGVQGRDGQCGCLHGAGCGNRRGRLQDQGGEGRRGLCHQRKQDIHHQRQRLRLHGGAVHHPPSRQTTQPVQHDHRPCRCKGRHAHQDQGQTGHSGKRHLRDQLRGREGPPREPARTGREGFLPAHELFRHDPTHGGLPGPRAFHGLPRCFRSLREGTNRLRRAAWQLSARPGQAGRNGHPDRGPEGSGLPGRVDDRPGPPRQHPVGHGQVFRGTDRCFPPTSR